MNTVEPLEKLLQAVSSRSNRKRHSHDSIASLYTSRCNLQKILSFFEFLVDLLTLTWLSQQLSMNQ